MRTKKGSGAVLACLTAVILAVTGCSGGNSSSSNSSKAESTASATTAGNTGSSGPDISTYRKLTVYTVGNFPQNDTKAVVGRSTNISKKRSMLRLIFKGCLGPPGPKRWLWLTNPASRSILPLPPTGLILPIT